MITIIDYNSGNIGSVTNSLDRLEQDYLVTSDLGEIIKAEKNKETPVSKVDTATEASVEKK